MYKIVGTVIHGKKNGRKIGFPTVNIKLIDSYLKDAVYCLNIFINDVLYTGVGTHLKSKGLFEAHIFDFDRDIYGEEIFIYIKSQIRPNKKFNDFSELQEQIYRDAIVAQKKHHRVLTFGSFDVIHPGHSYYLSEAKKYGEELITIIARDQNIESIKGQKTHHPTEQRVQDIKDIGICDIVTAGSIAHPMSCIGKYSPNSICLGYDQRGPFVDQITVELQKLGLQAQIIRIEAHEPDIYKSSLLKQKNNSTL